MEKKIPALLGALIIASLAQALPCPSRLATRHTLAETHPLARFLSSPLLARYANDPRNTALVEALGRGGAFHLREGVIADGEVWEQKDVLYVNVSMLRSHTPPHVSGPRSRNPLVWIAWAFSHLGANATYQPTGTLDLSFARFAVGFVEGIEKRLAANPLLTKVVILAPSVQSSALERLLVRRFGFAIVRPQRHFEGLGGSHDVMGSELVLRVGLDRPSPGR